MASINLRQDHVKKKSMSAKQTGLNKMYCVINDQDTKLVFMFTLCIMRTIEVEGDEKHTGHRTIGFQLIVPELGPHYILFMIFKDTMKLFTSFISHSGVIQALKPVTGNQTKVVNYFFTEIFPTATATETPSTDCSIQTV